MTNHLISSQCYADVSESKGKSVKSGFIEEHDLVSLKAMQMAADICGLSKS